VNHCSTVSCRVRVPFGPTKTESDRLRNHGESVNRKVAHADNCFVHFQVASNQRRNSSTGVATALSLATYRGWERRLEQMSPIVELSHLSQFRLSGGSEQELKLLSNVACRSAN